MVGGLHTCGGPHCCELLADCMAAVSILRPPPVISLGAGPDVVGRPGTLLSRGPCSTWVYNLIETPVLGEVMFTLSVNCFNWGGGVVLDLSVLNQLHIELKFVDESAPAALGSSFLSAYSQPVSSHIYLISEGTTLVNKVWESGIQLLMRLPVFICQNSSGF